MKLPCWNWAFPMSSQACRKNGLNSLRAIYAFSLAVFRLLTFDFGRAFMECSLMAFSHFSIAVSKLDFPMAAVDLFRTAYMGNKVV